MPRYITRRAAKGVRKRQAAVKERDAAFRKLRASHETRSRGREDVRPVLGSNGAAPRSGGGGKYLWATPKRRRP